MQVAMSRRERRNPDRPDKKGIETLSASLAGDVLQPWNPDRPDKKGIETQIAIRVSLREHCRNPDRPDKKGIETLLTQGGREGM